MGTIAAARATPESTPLERAVEVVGGQTTLARHLGVTQQAVSYWLRRDGLLPAEFCRTVENLTGVTRYELRPDVFGPGPAEQGA